MAKPSSIPRKAFRTTSSHKPPSSPLRPQTFPRTEPVLNKYSFDNDEAQVDGWPKDREDEEEDEDDFNPFTSHKSNDASTASSSSRPKTQSQPIQAESSLWLFNEDRAADSTNIMQTVVAPWGLPTSEDEDPSFTHLGKKLQLAPSNNKQPTEPLNSRRARVLSPMNDMASRLLSPTHKLTRQLYSAGNATRRPLPSCSGVPSKSSEGKSTNTSKSSQTADQDTQPDSACQSPAASRTGTDIISDHAAKVTAKHIPPPSALKNHHGVSLDPPKSLKKTRFADSDENVNRFTSSNPRSAGTVPTASDAMTSDPFEITFLREAHSTTSPNFASSAPISPKQRTIMDSAARPSNEEPRGGLPAIFETVNQTTAFSPSTLDPTSPSPKRPQTNEAPNTIHPCPKVLPTPLSPERPLASRLQVSGIKTRSSRALSVEILSTNTKDDAKVNDSMEKVKIQHMPLSSFKRLSRTNSANSKMFQIIQTAPTSTVQRASSVSNADMLRPSRVVRTLASLSGASEPDSQLVRTSTTSGKHPDRFSEPQLKTVEPQCTSSLEPSSGPSRLVPSMGKDAAQLLPSVQTDSSKRKKLPNHRREASLSGDDEGLREPRKASITDDSSQNLKAENRRPSNRIHVSERVGSRLSALIELPTPNSTVEAISSGDLEGVVIPSNLSMVCQNGGVPQFSTPYSAGPVSLPLPPDTIHLSASRPRRSGRKSSAGKRDAPFLVKPSLAPLTFEDRDSRSHSSDNPNHLVSNPPSNGDALPSQKVTELPEIAPVTSAPSTSATATSHLPNQNDNSTNPKSTGTLNAPALKNLGLDAVPLPLTEAKKGKAKTIDCPISSTKSTSIESRSTVLTKGEKQAKVVGTKPLPGSRVDNASFTGYSKPTCPPTISLYEPQNVEHQQTQRVVSTCQGTNMRPNIATISPTSPAQPTPNAKPPSVTLPKGLAPGSRLTRVKRPPVDSAPTIPEKSRVPSTSMSVLDNQPRPQDCPSTLASRSALDTKPPPHMHHSKVTDVMAPAAPLARVKRLVAGSASAASKKSGVRSDSTGEPSNGANNQPRVRNPPSTSIATSDAGPLLPADIPEDEVRGKRPSALDGDSNSAVPKKSRIYSGETGESSITASSQSRAGNRPTTSGSTARSTSPPRYQEATSPAVLAALAVLNKERRPIVLDEDSASAATAVSKKSCAPSAETGESSRASNNQPQADNLPTSTAISASAAMPPSPARSPEASNTPAVPSHLVRVKRLSTHDGDSASAPLKKKRVASAGTGESSRPPSNQVKVNNLSTKSSGLSRKPSSSQPRSHVISNTQDRKLSRRSAGARLSPSQNEGLAKSSRDFLPDISSTMNEGLYFVSNNLKLTEVVDKTSDTTTRSADPHPRPVVEPQGSLKIVSRRHSGQANASDGNPQRESSLNATSLLHADRASFVEPVEVFDAASAQAKTIGSSTERRCTVLLEVPSDLDTCHLVTNPEPLKSSGAQPVIKLVHTEASQPIQLSGPSLKSSGAQPAIELVYTEASQPIQLSGPSNIQPVKNNSSITTKTNHQTTGPKTLNHATEVPILTLPKQFDFAFRSTMPTKPRIKDVRAQTGNSTHTAAPSRRPPVPTTSLTKPLAKSKTLTRSRPDDSDADRAPKRLRCNHPTVASPSRRRVGPARPGPSNRVRSVVGRLNSLSRTAPAPMSSSLARGIRPNPSNHHQQATSGSSKTVGTASQSLTAEKTSRTISRHNNRVAPSASANQAALRNQLMREIRHKADMRASKQGISISDSITPASPSASLTTVAKNHTTSCLADIPEAFSQQAPHRVIQRNVSGASSSKERNPPRHQEGTSQKTIPQNSHLTASRFQSCLNQWREVEARQSTSSVPGSLGNSVQSRKLPEWQDVSLVHHVLPVKDHSRPKKPTMSFGLATERRMLERENWEQTRANKEKIEAEIRAQEELKAQELEREEFIKMRRECVIKANPVPGYLKKHT